jgi:hypothetical protein
VSYDIKKVIKQAGVASVDIGNAPRDKSNMWAEIELNSVNTVSQRLIIPVYSVKLKAKREKVLSFTEAIKKIIAEVDKTPSFVNVASDEENTETHLIQNITIAQSGRVNKE